MVTFDLERVKKFVIEKNNEELLNADQLCVVAAGDMGCVVALNWILSDWNWSASPKQGQDVKGAVLLSPAPTYKTLKTQPAFAHPFVAGKMSTMLIGGKTEAGLKNLYNQFKAKHAPTPTDEEEAAKHQDLFYIPLDTELRGTDLLHPDLMMWDVIRHFLDLRFVNKAENFPWQERKSPISK